MHVEELPSVKEVVSTLEDVRQRVADADLVDASRSAITSAREAVADGWPRRRRPSRWPWVAGVILGTTALGLVLLTPTFQRWAASRRASEGADGVLGPVTPAPAMPAAYKTRDPFLRAEPDVLDTAPLLDGGNGVAAAAVDTTSTGMGASRSDQ